MSLDFSITNTCEHCGNESGNSFNVTHNLGSMAAFVGVYDCLWRPEENGFTTAGQIIPLLEKGIEKMEAKPELCKKHNPENGWGSYAGFLDFLKRVLTCCERNKDRLIEADV